jgi:hypothetical protein
MINIRFKKSFTYMIILSFIGVNIFPNQDINIKKIDATADVNTNINTNIMIKDIGDNSKSGRIADDGGPRYFEIHDIQEVGQTAWGLASANFNNDSNIDFAVCWATCPWTKSTISLFYNNGNGNFTKTDVYTTYDQLRYLTDLNAGDYDNDGDIDLLFSYNEYVWDQGWPINVNGTVNILFNDGANNFGNETMVVWLGPGAPGNPDNRINPKLTSADYNKDGSLDFLVGDNSGKVELYINDATGHFTSAGIINDYGEWSRGFASVDYDHDGDIDVFVSTQTAVGQGYIYYKRNMMTETNGSTIFEPGPGNLVAHTGMAACLTPLDYDNDGNMDFIVGIMDNIYLCLSKPSGLYFFFIYQLPPTPDGYLDSLHMGALTSADYNNDGYADFIAGGVQGIVRLFLNTYGSTSSTITIEKPEEKHLYICNNDILTLPRRTIIFGPITICVNMLKAVVLQKVEFYLDGVLMFTNYTNSSPYGWNPPPYEWLWKAPSFGRHTLKVKAYDVDENYLAEDEITVWKFF